MNSTELNINLKALKKVDPYIISIEAHSGQVALYKFNGGKGDWEKTEVEGTLFVYQREADPQYGFTIMNRLSMDNLVEPVTRDLDFQLQSPFLLYRNHANEIFGIWFYEKTECEKVGKRIEELVKEVTDKQAIRKKETVSGKGDLQQLFKSAEVSKEPPQENVDTGRNLLRLLSQQNTEQPAASSKQSQEKPSGSVQDFFAAVVSSEAGQAQAQGPSAFTSVPGPGAPAPALFSGQQSAAPGPGPAPVPITAMPIQQGLALGMVPATGFHLMPGAGAAPPPLPGASLAGINPMVQRLMSNPGIHSVDAIEAEQRRSASPPGQEQQHAPVPPKMMMKNMSDLELDLKKKLHIGSSSLLDNNNDHTFAPVQTPDTRGGSVKLLSPQAFSRPAARSPSPPAVTNGVSPPAGQLTPLTQGQLVEAVSFLLEHDQDFVTKIHQAYVMSLTRRLTAK